MASQSEIDRLRLEADTIVTRYEDVEQALERARSKSGDHWETGELTVTLDTPQGETIDVTLALDSDPATNAQRRYERAAELAAERERREQVVSQLAPMPADPVAYLVSFHLERVEGNYPRSIAGHLDAERDHVERLCEDMEAAGLLERVESGTVKQRRVKAKQADEVRQHHTYYRLSRDGDHLLRFLDSREGKLNVLRHLPEAPAVVDRLVTDGPRSPRETADALDEPFEDARHRYRALRQVGLVTESDEAARADAGRDGGDESPQVTDAYYVATEQAADLLSEVELSSEAQS